MHKEQSLGRWSRPSDWSRPLTSFCGEAALVTHPEVHLGGNEHIAFTSSNCDPVKKSLPSTRIKRWKHFNGQKGYKVSWKHEKWSTIQPWNPGDGLIPFSSASDAWWDPGQVMQGSVQFSNSMTGARACRSISKSHADKPIKDCPVFRGSSMKDT